MTQEPHGLTRVLGLAKEYAVLTGVFLGFLYGVFRLGYVLFYVRLRTTPEEIRYNYSRVLSESIGGAVELMLLGTVVTAALTILYKLTARVILPPLHRGVAGSPMPAVSREFRKVATRRTAERSLAAGVALALLGLLALAWWQGGLAQRGQTVRNLYLRYISGLPVLAVQAVPADVAWKDGDTDKPFSLAGRECFMYLGQANGTTVFYDVLNQDSVRLPSSDIVVTLPFEFFVPSCCRPGWATRLACSSTPQTPRR